MNYKYDSTTEDFHYDGAKRYLLPRQRKRWFTARFEMGFEKFQEDKNNAVDQGWFIEKSRASIVNAYLHCYTSKITRMGWKENVARFLGPEVTEKKCLHVRSFRSRLMCPQ